MAQANQSSSSTNTAHWNAIYQARRSGELSWFESEPSTLERVLAACNSTQDRIVDIGAGASTLVDHLLLRGYEMITLVDVSEAALVATEKRLDQLERAVEMIATDLRTWNPAGTFDVWHDRATFHFMATPEDRASYKATLAAGLAEDGRAVIAAFSDEGPAQCASLPVARYNERSLAEEFSGLLHCTSSQTLLPTTDSTDSRPYVVGSFVRVSPDRSDR